MSAVTIYHNARCSNSRGALALLTQAGITPRVIDYLKDPPDRATLARLIRDAGLDVRAAMRTKEAPYRELQLDDPKWSDDELIGFMVEHPVLIQRPFVVTGKGTRLCRPPELVREIL